MRHSAHLKLASCRTLHCRWAVTEMQLHFVKAEGELGRATAISWTEKFEICKRVKGHRNVHESEIINPEE